MAFKKKKRNAQLFLAFVEMSSVDCSWERLCDQILNSGHDQHFDWKIAGVFSPAFYVTPFFYDIKEIHSTFKFLCDSMRTTHFRKTKPNHGSTIL